MLLLVMSIVMTGTYLIQATATEKENKVIEVLLSSANADEIMAGKLLGLGGAGLMQVAIWLTLTVGARLSVSAALEGFDVRVPWQALALSPVLFVIAYAFFGSLMLGTGSLGGNVRESQQLGMIWALFATLPVVFLPLILENPRGIVAIGLSWLPFTSPAALICRLSWDPDSVPAWELSGILAMMLFSTWLAVRVASRLFRVGLLLSGPRPSLRQIVAQARMLR
jgi:ABC-2 type transport system permease protein